MRIIEYTQFGWVCEVCGKVRMEYTQFGWVCEVCGKVSPGSFSYKRSVNANYMRHLEAEHPELMQWGDNAHDANEMGTS
jgi:ribosomal protein L37AE/L43A